MEGSPRSVYETLKRKAEGTLASKLFKTPKLNDSTSNQSRSLSYLPQVAARSSTSAQNSHVLGTARTTPYSPVTRPATSIPTEKGYSPETVNSSYITKELHKSPSPFAIEVDNAPYKDSRRSTPYSMQFSRSTLIDVDAVPVDKTPELDVVASQKNQPSQQPPRSRSSMVIDLDSDDDRQNPASSRPSVIIDLDSDNDSDSNFTTNVSLLHASRFNKSSATIKKEPLPLHHTEPARERASPKSATPPTIKTNMLLHNIDKDRLSSNLPSTSFTTSDTQTSSTLSTGNTKDPVILDSNHLKAIETCQISRTPTVTEPRHLLRNTNIPPRLEDESDEFWKAAERFAEEETKKDNDTVTKSLEDDIIQDDGSEPLSEDEAGSDTESENDADEDLKEEEEELDEVETMRQKLDNLNRSRYIAKKVKEQQEAQEKAAEERRQVAAIEEAKIEAENAERERVIRVKLFQERIDKERQEKERLEKERHERERIRTERVVTSNIGRSVIDDQDNEESAWEDFTQAQNVVTSEKNQVNPNEPLQESYHPPTKSSLPKTGGKPYTPISAKRFYSTQPEPVFGQVFKHDHRTQIGSIGLEEAANLLRHRCGQSTSLKTSAPLARGTNELSKLRAEAQKDAERIRAQQAKPVSEDSGLLEQIRQQAQQDAGNLKKGILPVNESDSQVQTSTASDPSTPENSQTHAAPAFSRSSSITTNDLPQLPSNRNIFQNTQKPEKNQSSRDGQPLELLKVTQTDWYLVELVLQGLSWAEIHEIWEVKTGQIRRIEYYRYRYRRMHLTFPDRVPPAAGARSITLKTKTKTEQHPIHTEKDVLSAISATPEETGRPTTGGKTISPQMAHYFMARSPTPELADTSDDDEENTMLHVGINSTARQETHIAHYTYQVERKAVLGGSNPDDVPWIAQTDEFKSKADANANAFRVIHTNNDGRNFDFNEMRGRFDKVDGLWSAESVGKEGTIYVRVNRRLRSSQEGVLIDKALPYTVYDVLEKRTMTITTKEWKLKSVVGLEYESGQSGNTVAGNMEDSGHEDSGHEDSGHEDAKDTGVSENEEQQTPPLRHQHGEQHQAIEVQEAASSNAEGKAEETPVPATISDIELDNLFVDEDEDTTNTEPPPAEKKRVRFAEEDEVQPHPDDILELEEPHTGPTEIDIDLNDYTLHTSTQTITKTSFPSTNSIFTQLYLANEAALLRLYTLHTESATTSFLTNPTIDDKDFSLNWKLPGRSGQSMDRAPLKKRVQEENDERLAQLYALEEAALEVGGGGGGGGAEQEAWSLAMMKDAMKGKPWSRVERWECGGKVEFEEKDDEEDEEEDETAVRKRTTVATEVEVWVQARRIEGPRNP